VSIVKYKGTLLAVRDIGKATEFYKYLLDLEVVMDVGANVELTGGVFLQTVDTWVNFVHKSKEEIIFSNNAAELYFETDDIDDFVEKLNLFGNIQYVHPLIEHSWGQRAVRFYDLDNHIIEVAENISMVIKNFFAKGLTIEQIAGRMDVDAGYIKTALER